MAEGGAAPPAEAVRRGVSRSLFTLTVLAVAVVAFLGGLGVGSVFFAGGPAPARTTLVVAIQAPWPPFVDFNTSSGEFEGFEIDLVNLIAEELNLTPVFRQFSSFPTLLAETGKGAVDMASASITITDARNATMDFSDPYYSADQGILVQTSSTLSCANDLCTANDLRNETIGVQQGTTSQAWVNDNVRSLMADPDNQIKVFTAVETEIAALKAGTLTVVMLDLPVAEAFANAPSSGLRVEGRIITNELYGFGLPNGDPARLGPVINTVLAKIKADGTYDDLITQWFG